MTRVLKLETKGFKSFANKTEIVYGEGFNVILGPNGSGKSNVLDALCFVLGKSGAKGLRAEKSANLIYNGGKSKTPAKQGEVSIYLDNSDNDFPLDTKIIKISRIIKQNGTSTYLINGEKHTREQILELLGNADIDPNGYNIILQGDIVRLVEMSPVERRGVIEEIAGIAVYEDKKRKAMNELDKIEHNLNEAEIILKEREGYLKEMKKERDQALQFKE
ncbi:MAG: AAA family ATPase, partial [Candidatus Woesearchaeota archaeon]